MSKIFKSELNLKPIGDGLQAELVTPLICKLGDELLSIPVGFQTDFASVPRIFWRIFPPHQYPYASVLHDFLYSTEFFDRLTCDWWFYQALLDTGASKTRAWIMYQAVKQFGWIVWIKHKKSEVNKIRCLAGIPPK